VIVSCLVTDSCGVGHLTWAAGDERRLAGGGQGSDGNVAEVDGLAGCRVARGQWAPCARGLAAGTAQLLLSYPDF